MESGSSHQRALNATAMIGGSSVVQIALGLLRTKVAALLLGPAGVGLIGLLQNLILTAGTIGAIGTNAAATRQLAAERAASGSEAAVRRALLVTTLWLAALASAFVWFFRAPIAARILSDASLADEVGWCALGVAATIIGNALLSLLAGLQRIADIARVNVLSGLAATVVSVAAIAVYGPRGLVAFVLAVPVALLLVGWIYARRAPRAPGRAESAEVRTQARSMFSLGVGIMVGMAISSVGQLAMRSMVGDRLGAEELGLVQASLTISIAYLGFVLQAMGVDYFPRLSAAMHDRDLASRVVNQQTELAILLAGPAIILLLGTAPWAVTILYSSQFAAAAETLRWQLAGDALKVAAWPLGFVMLASGRGAVFVALEALAVTIYVGGTFALLPALGIEAPGVAYLAMYAVYLPLTYIVARRLVAFRWSGEVIASLSLLCLATFAIALLAAYTEVGAALASLCIAGALAIRAARQLNIRPFRFRQR